MPPFALATENILGRRGDKDRCKECTSAGLSCASFPHFILPEV